MRSDGNSVAESPRFRFSPERRRSETEDLPARGEPRDGRCEKSDGFMTGGGVSMDGRLRCWGVDEEEFGGERELRSGGMLAYMTEKYGVVVLGSVDVDC